MAGKMIPSPGPVGTIVEFPKHPFCGMGGIGWRKRRAIVVAVNGNEATTEPWCRPSRGWRRHVRQSKVRKS